MNVRFKMTSKGEVAILPRKDYEVLAAKAQEADEDFGTARLIARATARDQLLGSRCDQSDPSAGPTGFFLMDCSSATTSGVSAILRGSPAFVSRK